MNWTKSNYLKKFYAVGIITAGLLFGACSTDDGGGILDPDDKEPIVQTDPPIVLDCDYFNGEDRVLTDNPNAAVDYIITCVMTVRNADIKIEPGVVIEFEQDAGIEIDGFNTTKASFSAIGTSDQPVIFRGKTKEKGYWRGLFFDSNSPLNKLSYVHVQDAGGKQFNSNGDLGAVITYSGSSLVLENSFISNSKTNGFQADYGGINLTLKNNVFTNNNVPVQITPQLIDAVNNTNDYKGNTKDYVVIKPYTQTINTPSTWHKINVPYEVLSTSVKGIGVNSLLTIEPGVVIEFGAGTFLKIEENGGGLKAVGTTNDPIILTGTSKVSKAWRGINIESKHSENEIAFAEFHYSGLDAPTGNIWLWYESLLNIHDVKFKNINGCGINYRLLGTPGDANLIIGSNITVNNEGCVSVVW
ncbi:hypothetical protein [Myroides indicus]|uniref:Parallel beta helix pectate lyase-like protein n=1 Tax=Myroides indicus TaxID=1323422 RepID=A0A4R7F179_9FLAO|nr:hypothetical protein [Myroides indicus]TDS58148.1 hypothetical protein C8P70_11360 [Myroides indicus]